MIKLLLSSKCLTIQKTPGLSTAGSASRLMDSCATMTRIKVRFQQQDHLTEDMESAANLSLLESIAIAMALTLAANQHGVLVTASETFSPPVRTTKCLPIVQVPETKKPAVSATTIKIST